MEGITTVTGSPFAIHLHGKGAPVGTILHALAKSAGRAARKASMHPCYGRKSARVRESTHHRKPTVAGMNVVCTSLW